MSDADLQRYLDLDEDDLHEELGAALFGDGRGFGSDDEERLRREGGRWFSSHLNEIREKICPKTRGLYEGDAADRVTDASALIDAVAGMAGHPVPTIVVALSIKYGLRNLCKGHA
ncbi:hypothetical protein ACR9E3_16730 [Actinomycetospora sp. C-140]